MGNHPIENIMETTMENIRNMVDVNTIVGDTVVMSDGTVIIPISKVSFGFVAGGGEYSGNIDRSQGMGKEKDQKQSETSQSTRNSEYPFAGGTGAGVSVSPMAFLVVSDGEVNLLPVQFNNSYERMLDKVPDLVCQIKEMFGSRAGKEGKPDYSGTDDEDGTDTKRGKDGKESWFSRNKRSKYDEEFAVDDTYRASKDEL
jgi:sporulation protein YtfJ